MAISGNSTWTGTPSAKIKKIQESLFGLCGLVGPKGGSKEKITIRGFHEDLAASFAPVRYVGTRPDLVEKAALFIFVICIPYFG